MQGEALPVKYIRFLLVGILLLHFLTNSSALNLNLPFFTPPSRVQNRNIQTQSTERTRDLLLEEIRSQQTAANPDFRAHKNKVIKLTENTQETSSASFNNFLASPGAIKLFHFSSTLDDIDKNGENSNINDKLWRTALKYGKVEKGLSGMPLTLDRMGPFTVPSYPKLPAFVITLTFSSFFAVRYLYDFDESTPGLLKYLEFQCITFGKLSYNRVVNREEAWKAIHLSENVQQPGDVLAVFALSNALNEEEGAYERLIAFGDQR